jgi:hypothetical protein
VEQLDALNWKVCLSSRPKGGTAEKTEKFGIESELGFIFEEEITEMNLFVKKTEEMQREMVIFLNQSKAMEMNNIYRVRSIARKNFKLTDVARKLLGISSVVLSSFSISKGEYRIEFLFHDSEIEDVSRVILQELAEKSDVRVEYIGPSGGFRNSIKRITERTTLTLIGIETDPPDEELKLERNPMGSEWVRIEKTPLGKGDINGIYFTTEKPSRKDVTEIVPGKIYFAATKNEFIREMDRLMGESRIPCISKINILKGRKFYTLTAVPDIFSGEYINIVRQVASSFDQWKPKIFRVLNIGEWIYKEKILP